MLVASVTWAKNDAPKKGEAVAPKKGEAVAPKKGEAVAPKKGEADTPKKGEADTPKKGEADTPKKGEADTPKKGEADTPKKGEADTPEKGEAVVFVDCKYSGRAMKITQTTRWIGPDLNEKISSVKVGPETEVILYEEADHKGKNVLLKSNEECLVDKNFNDNTSSIRLRQIPVEGEVWLYEDCDYEGASVKLIGEGSRELPDNLKRHVSSLQLGPNTEATLYDYPDFKGQFSTFRQSETCIKEFGDTAASVRIINPKKK
jgi:hypothetical protein